MLKYCVKRLLQSVVIIFVVVSIVFLLLRLMPIQGYFDEQSWVRLPWEVKLNRLQMLGIYDEGGQPINPFVQLFNFYKGLFTSFDFGVSTKIQVGVPVTQILADKIPYSVTLGLISTFFALIIGYTVGLFSAKYKGMAFDKIAMAYIVIVAASPAVIYYVLLQLYITKWTGWPMIFRRGDIVSWFTPILIMSITNFTGTALWLRRYTVDQLNSDYVKLAYAKGLPGTKVMVRHVMRNAFTPLAYGLPGAFILTIGGSLIIEQNFSIPGMGTMLIRAIRERDNNIVQTIVFLYSSLGVLSVFLGDVLATIVDPRIRLGNKESAEL